MPSSTSIPIIVQGNSFNLAIPLQIYVISEGSMVLQDYTPDPTDHVSIQLKGSRRQYTYTPTITGNTAFIELSGNEMADNYGVVVAIVKADGQRLRSFRTDQFFIVESSDDLTPDDIIEGLENNVIYLNSQAFVAGEDGRGIDSIVKTATAGLVDTYTITYTDNTTSTFDVTNGASGQQGADGVGITSIEKTATVGLVDTYTITLSNGQTSTFDVTNGRDGVDLGLATIVNNLTEGGSTNVLSAEMGKVLGQEVDVLKGIETYGRDAELDTDGKYYYTNGNYWEQNGVSTSRKILVKAGQTINVTLATYQANTLAIAVLRANNSCNSSISVPYVSGVHDYSFTAQEDTNVRICYKTSDGFIATIDQGNPTAKVDAKVEDILSRLGGTVIPFDQAKTYTFVNGSLVEDAGSLTTGCSTAKLNIADYKSLFYTGGRNTYNGYFCAVFFDDNDNYVGWGLRPHNERSNTILSTSSVFYDAVNVFEEIPEGATKVVLQTNIDIYTTSKVIAFANVPYNFVLDEYWKQDFYGVKGDGTTDDSTALQNLLNNSRGEVSLRAGTYLVSSSISINATKLRKLNGNGSTILLNADVSAIKVQGSCVADASPSEQGSWRIENAGFMLENIVVTSLDDTQGVGIEIKDCFMPMIRNCYVYHINNGIKFSSTNRNGVIEGCNVYQCYGAGILFPDGANFHQLNISNNHISYCNNCILFDNPQQIANFQLSGNDIEVGSNYPSGLDNCCIRVTGTSSQTLGEMEIVGNSIQGHSNGASIIVMVGNNSHFVAYVSIIGNHISNCMGNAIELSKCEGFTISGNTYKEVSNSTIKLSSTTRYIAVSGECIADNAKLLITDSEATSNYISVSSCVGVGSVVTINGTSQDYISVVGNNLGGGTVTIGTATHKQEANNI